MDSSTRWIAIAAVLGLCTAYAMWGTGAPPKQTMPKDGGPAPIAKAENKTTDPKTADTKVGDAGSGKTETKTSDLPPPNPQGTPPDPKPKVVTVDVPERKEFKTALVFDPPTVDLGIITVGENKSVTVQVKNPTAQKINISQKKGSCGCLQIVMPADSIEAGKSEELKLNFTGLPGKRPEKYTITLVTDEMGSMNAVLPVAGKVKQVFEVEPLTLYFDNVNKGESRTKEAIIKQVDGQPFKVKYVSCGHKEFAFKYSLVEGSNGSAYKIEVTVTGMKAGAITEPAAIVTDDPKVPVVTLNMGVRVNGEVSSSMPVLTGVQEVQKTVKFETMIKRNKPEGFSITGVVDDKGREIEFKTEAGEPGNIKLSIEFKAPLPSETMGEFLISHNVEADPLRLPYRVIMRGPQVQKNNPPIPQQFPPGKTDPRIPSPFVNPKPENKTGNVDLPPPVEKGSLEFLPASIDFGELVVNQTKTIALEVKNTSNHKITFKDKKVSCGCLKVIMPATSIDPGKSEPLTIAMTGLSGKRGAHYTMTLVTDDPVTPNAVLQISGSTRQVYVLEPLVLYFDQVAKGESKTAEAAIWHAEGFQFQIKNITCEQKEFSFKWEPAKASNGSAHRITVTATGLQAGSVTATATIHTDIDSQPTVPLTISARVTGDVVSSVPALNVVYENGRVPFMETVIKKLTPGKLTINNIWEGTGTPIEYTMVPVDDGNIKLTLKFKNELTEDRAGEFLLATNAEKQPLTIPYRVVVRPAPKK